MSVTIVRACRQLLNLDNIEAIIDGTGFSNTNPSHYYAKRVDGISVKNYTKTVFLTDNKTKLVLGIKTHSDHTNETTDFVPLVTELKKCLSTVLADKMYDSLTNRQYCWQNGIAVHIPLREWKQFRAKYGFKPHYKKHRRIAAERFNQDKYRYRVLVESVHSAIKRTLGSFVRAKRSNNQQKQVVLKTIAYNIEIIGRRIKIWLYINNQGFLHSQKHAKLIIIQGTIVQKQNLGGK